MTVPDSPEAWVTVREVQVPAGCWALWRNGTEQVSTSLFALCRTCPVKPSAQWLHLHWFDMWLTLADVPWACSCLKYRLVVCLPWPA